MMAGGLLALVIQFGGLVAIVGAWVLLAWAGLLVLDIGASLMRRRQ